MRLALVLSLVAGCAFEPRGILSDDDTSPDAAPETDAETDAETDSGPDPDAHPSTVSDADLPLPDASLPLPDAAPPSPDAGTPPTDAGTVTEMACTNGDDDDHDGATDCRDDDCPSCGGLLSCCDSGACALICL